MDLDGPRVGERQPGLMGWRVGPATEGEEAPFQINFNFFQIKIANSRIEN